jgi:hypothetical protein
VKVKDQGESSLEVYFMTIPLRPPFKRLFGKPDFHKILEREGVATKPSARRPESCGSLIGRT